MPEKRCDRAPLFFVTLVFVTLVFITLAATLGGLDRIRFQFVSHGLIRLS